MWSATKGVYGFWDVSQLDKPFSHRGLAVTLEKQGCGERKWACAGACLRPQNSNSNVVVSVTIHDDTKKIYIFF